VSRSRFLAAAAAVCVVVMSGGCAGSAASTAVPADGGTLNAAPAKVRFGLGGAVYPTYIVAQDQGFFAKENLTVEMNTLGSSGLTADALAAGQLDLGVPAATSSVLATVKGAKIIMVSGFENTFIDKTGRSWEAIYVVVRPGEGIQRLADLKGKKVCVSDIASFYNIPLRAQMLANKIDPDKDMTIVPVPYAQMPGALMQKLVDVAFMSPDAYVQVQRLGKIEVIATHTSLMNVSVDLTTAVAANADFLQRNPDVVVRFLRALLQARQWMAQDVAKDDGRNLIDLIARSVKYSPEQAKSFYETRAGYYGKELDFVNLLDVPTTSIVRNFELLRASGAINQDVPTSYEQVVDIRPLKRAYESLGLKWDESKH
jgi:NitT/TauT family transport system substrate-binding protein